MAVPRSPEEFIQSYVPARVAELAAELAGKSSPGSVVFRLDDGAVWSFRLLEGALQIEPQAASDAVVVVSMARDSFEPLVVRGAERDELKATSERRLSAIRALSLDASRAQLVRNAAGSVAVVIKDNDREHRVVATPGAHDTGAFDTRPAACTLRLAMGDFVDLQSGRAQPLQLMMTGALVIEGDAQIVMNLAAALSAPM